MEIKPKSLPYIWDKEERRAASKIYGTDEWYRRVKEGSKGHAKRAGIVFDIRSIDIKELFIKEGRYCCYCKISTRESFKKWNTRLTVDRKDSSLGYIKGNLCLACIRCNTIKGNYVTYEQMLQLGPSIRSFCDHPDKFWNFGRRNQK